MIIDPSEISSCPGINPLEGADPDLAVDNVVAIFRRTFEQYWGPRTDDILRVSCLTLLRRGQATLTEIPRLLSDEIFRARCTKGLDDPDGLGGFWQWYAALSEAARAQAVGPLVSKLRAFLLRPFVRAVVGGEHTTLDISQVLDGGVLIARLPKGTLGSETCELLGSFLNDAVWQAITARAAVPEAERHDAIVVLDEFQDFVARSKAFSERLAQARKYHVGYVLAHQFLGQLPADLRLAVSGEARSKVYFAMSSRTPVSACAMWSRSCARGTSPALPPTRPRSACASTAGWPPHAPSGHARLRRQTRPGPRWCGPRHGLASPSPGQRPHPPRRRSRAASPPADPTAPRWPLRTWRYRAGSTVASLAAGGSRSRRSTWTGRQMSAPLRRRRRWRRSSRSSR